MPNPTSHGTQENSGWCHCCENTVEVKQNEETLEFECSFCGGNFVEFSGQGVEIFTSTGHTDGADIEMLRDEVNNNDEDLHAYEEFENYGHGRGINSSGSMYHGSEQEEIGIGYDGGNDNDNGNDNGNGNGNGNGNSNSSAEEMDTSTQTNVTSTTDVVHRVMNRVLRSQGLQTVSTNGPSRSIALVLRQGLNSSTSQPSFTPATLAPTLASINSNTREGVNPIELIDSFLTSVPNANVASNSNDDNRGGAGGTDAYSTLLSRGLLSLTALGNNLMDGVQGSHLFEDGGSNRSFENLLHHLMMNESSHASHPVTPKALEKLTRIHMKKDTDLINEWGSTDTSCGITLDPLEEGEIAIVLGCKHIYKEASILEWFKHHNTCPVCRKNVEQQGDDNDNSINDSNDISRHLHHSNMIEEEEEEEEEYNEDVILAQSIL